MPPLRYTLLADGPSDRALLPIINWCLAAFPAIASRGFVDQVADLRDLKDPPKGLSARMQSASRLYPSDLLLVHRDAEGVPLNERIVEIERHAGALSGSRTIPVVPVRMTEAWLLIDEQAIRFAADNPRSAVALELPSPRSLERIADPKRVLRQALITASEKRGRRRHQFERDLSARVERVAVQITDFRPLRQLSAFQSFEERLGQALADVTD